MHNQVSRISAQFTFTDFAAGIFATYLSRGYGLVSFPGAVIIYTEKCHLREKQLVMAHCSRLSVHHKGGH